LSKETLLLVEQQARDENLDRVEWIRREIEVGLRRRSLKDKASMPHPGNADMK
jgi:hypothetical protein